MTAASTIRYLALLGMSPREIAAVTGYDAAAVRARLSQDRQRQGLDVSLRKAGRPRTSAGDAMALAYERCGNYSLVARAFGAAPSTVFEAVQRRAR